MILIGLEIRVTLISVENYYFFCVIQNEGRTPLHVAARKGDEDMVKYLQTLKVNPNTADNVRYKLRVFIDYYFLEFTLKDTLVP